MSFRNYNWALNTSADQENTKDSHYSAWLLRERGSGTADHMTKINIYYLHCFSSLRMPQNRGVITLLDVVFVFFIFIIRKKGNY
jgi:hypothetical protein